MRVKYALADHCVMGSQTPPEAGQMCSILCRWTVWCFKLHMYTMCAGVCTRSDAHLGSVSTRAFLKLMGLRGDGPARASSSVRATTLTACLLHPRPSSSSRRSELRRQPYPPSPSLSLWPYLPWLRGHHPSSPARLPARPMHTRSRAQVPPPHPWQSRRGRRTAVSAPPFEAP